MPTKILLFSRDRAMQLDALLRSFFLRCQDCQQGQVYALYRASTAQHARQYHILKEAYPEVNFIEQTHFRCDVLRILNPFPLGSLSRRFYDILNQLIAAIIVLEGVPVRLVRSVLLRMRTEILGSLLPEFPDDRQILFLVDDNIFTADFSLTNGVQALQEHPDALGFSLRLGANMRHCYSLDQPQSLPEFIVLQNEILKFDWTTAELDFAYPLEVSSSIYRVKDILPILATRPFGNPNELEYILAVSAVNFVEQKPLLLCPEVSYTFCNPLNLVQNFAPNRAGDQIEYSSERLADLFDQGYRVNIAAYHGFVSQSCHQEAPLEFYQLGGGAQ